MGILYGETLAIADPFLGRLTDDTAILMQALYMRLSTKRGTLWADPEYGLSLQDLVLAGLTADNLARIPAAVQAEVEKDARVASATVTATVTQNESLTQLVLTITVSPSTGPTFDLVIAATELTVQLLTRAVGS